METRAVLHTAAPSCRSAAGLTSGKLSFPDSGAHVEPTFHQTDKRGAPKHGSCMFRMGVFCCWHFLKKRLSTPSILGKCWHQSLWEVCPALRLIYPASAYVSLHCRQQFAWTLPAMQKSSVRAKAPWLLFLQRKGISLRVQTGWVKGMITSLYIRSSQNRTQ